MAHAFQSFDERFGGGTHKGFSMKFANRFEVSVVWHSNSSIVRSTGETVAEIGIIDPNGKWDVHTHSTPEEVAEIIAEVAKR